MTATRKSRATKTLSLTSSWASRSTGRWPDSADSVDGLYWARNDSEKIAETIEQPQLQQRPPPVIPEFFGSAAAAVVVVVVAETSIENAARRTTNYYLYCYSDFYYLSCF